MSPRAIEAVDTKEFQATAIRQVTSLAVTLTGTADSHSRREFDDFVTRVHDQAKKLKVKEVTVDLRGLEFMNSACFKSMLQWVSAIQRLDPDDQYGLRLISNNDMYWQRRSLHALRCFATELITVE
jgi:hypothetical protein